MPLALRSQSESDLRLPGVGCKGVQSAVAYHFAGGAKLDRKLKPRAERVGIKLALVVEKQPTVGFGELRPRLIACDFRIGAVAAEEGEIGFAEPAKPQAADVKL